MITSQLDSIISDARNGVADALVTSCELFLDNYPVLRVRNLINACHLQMLKLHWILIQKRFSNILIADSSIKDKFINVRTTPTLIGLQDLLKYTTLAVQKHSPADAQEYMLKLSVVFNKSGTLLPSLVNTHFNDYEGLSEVKKYIAKYNQAASFHSYTLLVQNLLNLSKKIDERKRGLENFEILLTKWNEIETSPDVSSLKQRCETIAGKLGRKNELSFAEVQYRADKGLGKDIAELGIFYEQGVGVRQDDGMAKTLYMKAINAGYKEAQVYLTSLNDRHKNQLEQETERRRIQSQLEIQRKEQELRRLDIEERSRLEYQRQEEERRHNQKMEEMARERNENTRRQQEKEEELCKVLFNFSLYDEDGHLLDGDRVRTIPRSLYEQLVNGGERAITSYIEGIRGVRRGVYIGKAYMERIE